MDYREALCSKIDEYLSDVILPYKAITMAAMKDARKPGLFKKVDFAGHIENFENQMKKAVRLLVKRDEIPETDVEALKLEELFAKSADDFIKLCKVNIVFYDICQKKQYRKSHVKMKEYKNAFDHTQVVLMDSIKSLDQLDKAYKKFIGENTEDDGNDQAPQPDA